MNWVAIPRYSRDELWIMTLTCGHTRISAFVNPPGRDVACTGCRDQFGFTGYSPVWIVCPVPRPLNCWPYVACGELE